MATSAECYAKAHECNREALEARSGDAREALLEVAAAWRTIGNDLKKRKTNAESMASRLR